MAFRLAFAWGGLKNCDAICKIKRGAQTVSKARFQTFTHDNPIHNHVNVVTELLVQCGWFIQLIKRAIDFDTLKALLAQLHEFFAIFTFAIPNNRRKKIAANTLFQSHDPIDHVLHLLRFNRKACCRRIGCADARKQ